MFALVTVDVDTVYIISSTHKEVAASTLDKLKRMRTKFNFTGDWYNLEGREWNKLCLRYSNTTLLSNYEIVVKCLKQCYIFWQIFSTSNLQESNHH